ncbi:type II toxin-antitoxin system HicB family antitoxin [Roseibium sp. RKSG952]|uniref:type II toxin-antitoxin system HicB family antitoxin n=1 Tax=Roseibium sp. RKSG952 TaxID=2529384 RepID=UPI0012BD513C|nr:type II toxin-antitoxin system HicB family antitoxin [Roseibium sp. RKSG952]MTH98115.1 type II toxin-antitoxin system HicB family antitoxin [Roseibium sp. RKSG952]
MGATFYAELTADPDGGFVVTFRDLPEAITGGGTRAEALEMAADALAVALLGRLDDGETLPLVQDMSGVPVTVPAQFAAKIALIEAFEKARKTDPDLSQSSLARRLGIDHKEIRRRLDPNHKTKLSALEETLKALGKRLVIQIEDAA